MFGFKFTGAPNANAAFVPKLRRLRQPVTQGINSVTLYGLGELPSGTYALQLQYNDQLVSKKLVKVIAL